MASSSRRNWPANPLPFKSRYGPRFDVPFSSSTSASNPDPDRKLKKEIISYGLSPASVIMHQAKVDTVIPQMPSPVCSPSPSSSPFAPSNSATPAFLSAELLYDADADYSSSRGSERDDTDMVMSTRFGGAKVSNDVVQQSSMSRRFFPCRELRSSSSNHSRGQMSCGTIDKFIMEDEMRLSPSVPNHFTSTETQELYDTDSSVSHYRHPSDISSLGSANRRTLSMEFDALLAAAVRSGAESEMAVREDEIWEDASSSSEPRRSLSGQRREEEIPPEVEPDIADHRHAETQLQEVALSAIVPYEPQLSCDTQSMSSMTSTSSQSSLSLPPSSNQSLCTSSSSSERSQSSKQLALQKVRRGKILAIAMAYQMAKNAKYENRYKREEAKIDAWERQQRIKATLKMKQTEMKLEEKRAKALEKMENEIAHAHKKAEEDKAKVLAIRGIKSAIADDEADWIRRTGKMPGKCCLF